MLDEIFYWTQKVQKGVTLVDLVKSFPFFFFVKSFQTNIYLQNLASKQPRTGLSKFAPKYE